MSLAEFRRDNAAYLAWVAEHPSGFVINIQRTLNPADARLHRASCAWIRGKPPRGSGFVGPSYIKVCSESLPELSDWALTTVGATVTSCGTCRPPGPAPHRNWSSQPTTPAREPSWQQATRPVEDVQHEFEGPSDDLREVWMWADTYIPFDKLTPAQKSARTELRRRLALLSGGPQSVLHAVYTGDKPADSDVENLLLYNIGDGCFRPGARQGTRFELGTPPKRQPPSRQSFAFSYAYRLTDKSTDLNCWRKERQLATFTGVSLGRFAASARASRIWLAVRRSDEVMTGTAVSAGTTPFGVFLTLHYPGGVAAWPSPGLVKPVIDGVVSAFQSHSDQGDLGEISHRIASSTGQEPTCIAQLLQDARRAVLGPVSPLVRLLGRGVQWNPSDHMCVAGELICLESIRDDWRLSGQLWALSPHPPRQAASDALPAQPGAST